MRFDLRDRDRIWSIATGPGIHPGRGGAVGFPASLGVLSGLLLDAGNRDIVREALSSAYPREPRPVAADPAGLLRDLETRLRTREWILFIGPPAEWIGGGRAGGPSGRPGTPAAPEEAEEAVPLFEPDGAWEKAWSIAAVELSVEEVEPAGESAGAVPAEDWGVEAVFLGDDETVPATAAPRPGQPGELWEIADAVLDAEEIGPGNEAPGD